MRHEIAWRGTMHPMVDDGVADAQDFVSSVKFDARGLVPVIAQQWDSKTVLMMAWMNAESLALTLESGMATYFSRSRNQLWQKGETSGNGQRVIAIQVDCDRDTLLLEVDQTGPACHTGLPSCFDSEVRVLVEHQPGVMTGD